MLYEWDEAKRQTNIDTHGIDFAAIHLFEWGNATIFADDRFDYAEKRLVAYGMIKERLVVVVYTVRGNTIRIISLRKANKREVDKYGY